MILTLAGVSFPAWKGLLESSARKAGVILVMNSLDHARREAIGSGREVWVLFRREGNGRDSLRLASREKEVITPLGGWIPFPAGCSLIRGAGGIGDLLPPAEIMAVTGPAQGAVMFQRTGGIGWPRQGNADLLIRLRCGQSDSLITLTRGTGRAELSADKS